MRKLIVSSILGALALIAVPAAHAQMKVGVVDMNQIFTSYYKTKDAETKINAQRADAKKDLDSRLDVLKKAMADANSLDNDAKKPELSKDARDEKAKERDAKVAEARNMDQEIQEYRQSKERELQEQFLRMRKDLIDDIMVVLNDKVKAGGYDLVFDKSGVSMGQIPILLYSRADMEFSSDVISALNKNAPKSSGN